MAVKQLHLDPDTSNIIEVIAAKAGARSKTSFVEDLFMAYVRRLREDKDFKPIRFLTYETDYENGKRLSPDIDGDTFTEIRILASGMRVAPKIYMQSFLYWLVDQYQSTGTVWFDDTPVSALPVR